MSVSQPLLNYQLKQEIKYVFSINAEKETGTVTIRITDIGLLETLDYQTFTCPIFKK